MINELGRPYTRRAALVMATAAVTSASLLAPPGPADAASRSAAACIVVSDLFYDEVQIVAERVRDCGGDPENIIPLSTAIARNGVTVASGSGRAVYHCTDTELSFYQLRLTTRSVTATCS